MKLSEEDIDSLINNKPFTLGSCRTQQEEETMNDNLNTQAPITNAGPEVDAELAKLLAIKPVDGEIVGFVTDADETADEAAPTIH